MIAQPPARRTARSIGIVAAVLAFAATAAYSTRTAPETFPVADTATTSIYTLRAGRGELAVGSYSRFGWNHPGPLLYQVLAGPYLVSGRREIALKWSALGLNLVWIGGLLALTARRSPRLAVAVAIGLVPLLWREQRLLFFPWNPVAPVLALAFAVALAADLGARRWWTPALLVAVLSFCVQAHVGLALPALAIVLAAAVAASTRPAGNTPAWPSLAAVLLALGVGALLWARPLVHELRDGNGNLAPMVRFLLDGAQPHPTWGRALEGGAYMLVGPFLPAWQMSTGEIPSGLPAWLPAVAALLLAGVVVATQRAIRRGQRFEAAFGAACAGATIAVPVAAHGIVGPMSDYLLLWAAAIGALDAAVVLTALLAAAPGFPADRVSRPLVAVAVTAWALVGAHRLINKHAEQARDPTVRALSLDLQRYCRERGVTRPVLAYAPQAWQEAAGIVLQFDKADLAIAVADEGLYLVGPPFARTGREAATFYLMPMSGAALPADAGQAVWVTSRGAYRIVRIG